MIHKSHLFKYAIVTENSIHNIKHVLYFLRLSYLCECIKRYIVYRTFYLFIMYIDDDKIKIIFM